MCERRSNEEGGKRKRTNQQIKSDFRLDFLFVSLFILSTKKHCTYRSHCKRESECTRQLNYGYLHFICMCLIAGCHLNFLSLEFSSSLVYSVLLLLLLPTSTTHYSKLNFHFRSKQANFLRVKYAPFAPLLANVNKENVLLPPKKVLEKIH